MTQSIPVDEMQQRLNIARRVGITLHELGFTKYETMVLDFARVGPFTAKEGAINLGIPYARIYETLRSLETWGLLTHDQMRHPVLFRLESLPTRHLILGRLKTRYANKLRFLNEWLATPKV